jgi:hypothetical protein
VPCEAYLGEDYFELIEKACNSATRSTALLDLEGKKHEQGSDHIDRRMLSFPGIVCVVRDDEAQRELLAGVGGEAMPSTSGHAVRLHKLDEATFDRLHASGDCLGCFSHHKPDGEDLRVAAHGIYQYNHGTGNAIASPYARAERPSTPAHIDRLPAELREHAVSFPGKFAGTLSLQPAELWQCESWGPVDRLGRTHHPPVSRPRTGMRRHARRDGGVRRRVRVGGSARSARRSEPEEETVVALLVSADATERHGRPRRLTHVGGQPLSAGGARHSSLTWSWSGGHFSEASALRRARMLSGRGPRR